MAQPRISYDGDQNAAGNDGTKLDRRDASAGQEYFPLGGGASTPIVRKPNQTISAQAGNPNFPRSVLEEGRAPVDDIGLGDNPKE